MANRPPGPSTRPTRSPQTASTSPQSSTAHTPLQTAPPRYRHQSDGVPHVLAGPVDFGVVVGEVEEDPFTRSGNSRYSPRVGSASVDGADGVVEVRQTDGRALKRAGGVDEVGTSSAAPPPKAAERRPRARERRWVKKRQWQLPHAAGYPNCNYVDNSIFTCFPESNTTLVQNDYSLVIWNAMQPSFISRQYVDVYLYNADTQDVATSWKNESNAQGMIGIVPSDPWWPGPQSARSWFGSNAQNRTTPYFFVVVPAGHQLTGGEVHGATFRAIQTAAPSSLSSSLAALTASSMSSASSASAASAFSSLSALSASSVLAAANRTSSSISSSNPSGTSRSSSLQNNSSSGPAIPRYAIALIVILGFLALVGGAIALYLLGRARRRRRERKVALVAGAAGAGAGASRSGDFMSEDDFTHGSQDPILGAGGARGSASSARPRAPSSVAGAGAGAAGGFAAGGAASPLMSERDESTLSHSDAARMAKAFRAALRRPDFPAPVPGAEGATAAGVAAGPGAGPSPTGAARGDVSNGSGEGDGVGRGLLENELRGEGKSMRQVEGRGKGWSAGSGGGAGS